MRHSLANADRARASSIKPPSSCAILVSATVPGKRRSVRFFEAALPGRIGQPRDLKDDVTPEDAVNDVKENGARFRSEGLPAFRCAHTACGIQTTSRGAKSIRFAAYDTEATEQAQRLQDAASPLLQAIGFEQSFPRAAQRITKIHSSSSGKEPNSRPERGIGRPLPAGHFHLASADLKVGGVDYCAVAATGAAAHYQDNVFRVAGTAADQLVVPRFFRALGHTQPD